jgi:hypothetical protein
MPDLTYTLTVAQAARIVAALRGVPDRQGNLPPADATNTQLLAHARRVHLDMLISTVRSIELRNPDPELDGIA